MTRDIMIRVRTATQPWLLPADDPTLLDAIDAAVAHRGWTTDDPWDLNTPDTLERMLAAANFAWRVNADWRGLERRIDPTATAAVTTTIHTTSEEAAGHLAAAWDACHGPHPDPDKAYAEAVKAVEASACALVLPANGNATLGTVRDHPRDAPAKWELDLPRKDGTTGAVTPVVGMLTALYEGQRSRHAGTASARRQTQAEAEAAVHLAATPTSSPPNAANAPASAANTTTAGAGQPNSKPPNQFYRSAAGSRRDDGIASGGRRGISASRPDGTVAGAPTCRR